jgi:hypothetical protein
LNVYKQELFIQGFASSANFFILSPISSLFFFFEMISSSVSQEIIFEIFRATPRRIEKRKRKPQCNKTKEREREKIN